jgi:hypothetical protein
MKVHESSDVADILPHIPLNAKRLLLIGGQSEGLAAAFKNLNPQAFCVALRPLNSSKQSAEAAIDQWLNIDLDAGLSKLTLIKSPMDLVLVMADTWALVKDAKRFLKELRRFMAKDAVCLVWAPNVSHWQRMEQLLQGTDQKGMLFDSAQILGLLSDTGWTVQTLSTRQSTPQENEKILQRWSGLIGDLNMDTEQTRRSLLTKQWVVSAINGPAVVSLHVAAVSSAQCKLGSKEARMQYPLHALKTLPGVRCVHEEATLAIPPQFKPGILMIEGQWLNNPSMLDNLDKKVKEGWVLVADMDEDPMGDHNHEASHFMAIKGVHAVTVSTPELARRIGRWNPCVHVLPNAVHWIDNKPQAIPKNKERVRIFYGAVNRQKDWQPIIQGVLAAAINLGDSIEFVVVHDKAFHDALPKTSQKTFHESLTHAAYTEVLTSCDLALLPLADNSVNRCKSDLHLIECASAGVVPICSSVVYAENPAHHSFAKFADTPVEYMATLIKLCKQTGELNRRAKLGHAHVSKYRTHAMQASIRRDLYLSLLNDREALEAQRQERLQAMNAFREQLSQEEGSARLEPSMLALSQIG